MRPGPQLAGLVLVTIWLALTPFQTDLAAQTPEWTRLPSLRFLGLRAGMPLTETEERVADLFGGPLTCQGSAVDPRVADCRSSFPDPVTGRPVALWLSAIDSLVAVLTVSGPVSQIQLLAWRSSLESAFGPTDEDAQGNQRSLRWIRHRQMLRLTWRDFGDSTTASVALVDGPILDGWARRRDPLRSDQ